MIHFLVGTATSVLEKMVSVTRNGKTAPRPLMWYIESGAKAVSDVFGDSSKDPTRGNVGSLMSPFLHDLNNAARNTDTPDIKN